MQKSFSGLSEVWKKLSWKQCVKNQFKGKLLSLILTSKVELLELKSCQQSQILERGSPAPSSEVNHHKKAEYSLDLIRLVFIPPASAIYKIIFWNFQITLIATVRNMEILVYIHMGG